MPYNQAQEALVRERLGPEGPRWIEELRGAMRSQGCPRLAASLEVEPGICTGQLKLVCKFWLNGEEHGQQIVVHREVEAASVTGAYQTADRFCSSVKHFVCKEVL